MKLGDSVQPSQDVAVRNIGDEVLILTLKDTSLYSMNEVGRCIWRTLSEGNTSVNAIIEAVAKEYDVEAGLISEDVLEFLNELSSKGIVEVNSE